MNIDTVNPVTDETAAAGIGGNSDIIDAADLLASEANGAGGQPETPQADAQPKVKPEDRRYTTDDMSKAVQNRLKQERRGAAYQLGREMLDEYMAANNIQNEADALAKIREDRIKTKAAAFKANPEKGFEEMLRMRSQPIEPAEETRTAEAYVESLYNSIVEDMQAGKVPQDFDLNAYLSEPNRAREFIEWYQKLGMERACSIASRLIQPRPSKADVNRALPRPISTNNSYQPANIDYMSMTSEEFAAVEKRIKQARAQGKKVR